MREKRVSPDIADDLRARDERIIGWRRADKQRKNVRRTQCAKRFTCNLLCAALTHVLSNALLTKARIDDAAVMGRNAAMLATMTMVGFARNSSARDADAPA